MSGAYIALPTTQSRGPIWPARAATFRGKGSGGGSREEDPKIPTSEPTSSLTSRGSSHRIQAFVSSQREVRPSDGIPIFPGPHLLASDNQRTRRVGGRVIRTALSAANDSANLPLAASR